MRHITRNVSCHTELDVLDYVKHRNAITSANILFFYEMLDLVIVKIADL